MFSKFSATMGAQSLEWNPKEPCLTGDAAMLAPVRKLIASQTQIALAANGPYMISIEAYAPVVFTAINKVYGYENITYVNPPDFSNLIEDSEDLREIEY